MKLPYGESSFEKIRTGGYCYVDKTRYIELLETESKSYVMMLRPRRFGKSLFCDTLACYYDRRYGDRFAKLFKGTYMYDHPTPGRNACMVLNFDFSGISTETLADANEGFAETVRSCVDVFLGLYGEHFSPDEYQHILSRPKPNYVLTALFDKIRKKDMGRCVCVIIDEYDHFANNILSQRKENFKDLVRTEGYVRPFYEALKKGTKTVVDRIFITGVMPILLDSLTSGFNIAANLSTDVQYNEMFGFTDEEITPILESLYPSETERHREVIRTYYDGYRFSPLAERTVYNSDMVLYYGCNYDAQRRYIDTMVDVNVVSDYRKIRAILSFGEKPLEEAALTRIVRDKTVSVREIQQLFVLTWETEFLFNEAALLSLLFYMGYLTIFEKNGLDIVLKTPNAVLESLYLEYMERLLTARGEVRIGSEEKRQMFNLLIAGNPDMLVKLTEKLLKGLSNRDYQRFDEKYVKVAMLSLLSAVNVYIPHSEFEVDADGYADIYLQAAFEPERSAHFFLELKYAKAKDSRRRLDALECEAKEEMRKYLRAEKARAIPNLQPYILIFRKDRCVRKIRFDPN